MARGGLRRGPVPVRGRVGALARPSRWSLRTRLLTTLIALLAAVCLVVGLSAEVALRHFLLGRLDSQLLAAGNRSAGAVGAPADTFGASRASGGAQSGTSRSDGDGGIGFLQAPGQSANTVGARIVAGRVTVAGVLSEGGAVQPLSAKDAAVLAAVPVDQRPHTATLRSGSYRLLAARAPDGDIFVTGLPLTEVNETLDRLARAELGVAAAGLAVAALAGAAIIRATLRPLRRVAGTASRVSTLQLDRGEVALAERVPDADTDPRTEVGQVGAALNRLLGHVGAALAARQASETRVRQFVADASHELRTPLAAIRGYAELTRRSREQAPPDLARAMERVESEAGRMTTLVEDLLLLARLDAGRPLAAERVDLTRLVIDSLSDASAAGPDHRWQLLLPDEPVTVVGDSDRLHQVLANLLANARTHTPPGTTVTASLETNQPGQTVLAVLDDGPGIPAELLPHVFERFARGDKSRNRVAGSSGLGLAIVTSVVTAHGGTVEVTSRPGHTAFLIRFTAATPISQTAEAPTSVAQTRHRSSTRSRQGSG
jgi:two-component system, OmpR family, sensor kinase